MEKRECGDEKNVIEQSEGRTSREPYSTCHCRFRLSFIGTAAEVSV